ncbi:phospholipase D family protein [Nocardioides sp. GY 10127]|uniref:phospholipase D family protein n=1 Tax=Nocardioides sp. GY 10127 TaxID=2569762 RepID=UPI0010A9366E|nr:phospholipase D family protein [Nocardioides sp. GY 10127]TIC82664.1 phospholipase [Nocardioides sp. GY 10127]
MIDDWLLTSTERGNPHTRIDGHRSGGAAWATGSAVRPIVHGHPYLAELHARVSALGEGDRLYFTDWRGDPDEQLTDDPGSTLTDVLVAALGRGVDVRGLLWRSHWSRLGYSAEGHLRLGEAIGEAGGECLRDMRVRARGSHHQKLVVLRHRDAPERDVAYVGGIDLCHSRRDDARHLGDHQAETRLASAYGSTPAWHDVQVAVTGPAVLDVETTFRERWEDSLPLTVNPGRWLSSRLQREQLEPSPLGAQWPAPPSPDGAHDAVQVLRTYPSIRPRGFDFAPDGERSVRAGNLKSLGRARRLVYVEDQYLWSEEVGEHYARALRENPDLRCVFVLPLVPDEEDPLHRVPQLYGRSLAMRRILEAGGDRVAVFGLSNEHGLPVYVHAKTCIVDGRWASVGSDNLNRRSWTHDSEVACAVLDERDGPEGPDGPAPADAFPRVLLRTLAAEHLGCEPEAVPEDPHALFDAMVACADALDEWFAGGVADPAPDPESGVRGRVVRRVVGARPHVRDQLAARVPARLATSWQRQARLRADAEAHGTIGRAGAAATRPPGRLRRLAPPVLTPAQERWAKPLYELVFDPDGRPPGLGAD